jgi:hypothetical protein
MARLDLTFSEIYSQVSDFLGLGTSPSGTNLTKVKNLVHRAYRQFLYPLDPRTNRIHRWSFLQKPFHVKLDAGTWKYTLPYDFVEMIGNPQYGDEEPWGELKKADKDYILTRRALCDVKSYPEVYAVVPVSHDSELGTFWELWLWPEPSDDNSLTFWYTCSPEKLDATTDFVLGGPLAGEVILEMAMGIAESQEEGTLGIHTQEANRLLTNMIFSDTATCPDQLGKMSSDPEQMARLGTRYYGVGTDWLYAADR